MLLGFEVGGCMGQWLVVVLWAAVEAWAVLEEVAWGWVAQEGGCASPRRTVKGWLQLLGDGRVGPPPS
jgi:hypothetical protein